MTNVVVASFDSGYFDAGMTLIASLHRTSREAVDKILIFDLGLSSWERALVRKCDRVVLLPYPAIVDRYFPGFMEPQQFAWKPLAIREAGRHGDRILYLDAGVMALRNLGQIFQIIDRDEIFLVQDAELNSRWTHARAFQLMAASEKEKSGRQLSAGILGYKAGGRYQAMIDQAQHFAQNPEIIRGDHLCHRHDQSIYSVLAIRYLCPTQPMEIYGEWRGILSASQVLLVHRRQRVDFTGLLRRGAAQAPVRPWREGRAHSGADLWPGLHRWQQARGRIRSFVRRHPMLRVGALWLVARVPGLRRRRGHGQV